MFVPKICQAFAAGLAEKFSVNVAAERMEAGSDNAEAVAISSE